MLFRLRECFLLLENEELGAEDDTALSESEDISYDILGFPRDARLGSCMIMEWETYAGGVCEGAMLLVTTLGEKVSKI